ncbi:MAG: hypothetical protein WDN44_12145 [Sphingomonas sp.]
MILALTVSLLFRVADRIDLGFGTGTLNESHAAAPTRAGSRWAARQITPPPPPARITAPPPPAPHVPPAPPAAAQQALHPNYLRAVERCDLYPYADHAARNRDILSLLVEAGGLQPGTDAVVKNLTQCLGRVEPELRKPDVLAALGATDGGPYLRDLARRRELLKTTVPAAIARIDLVPAARDAVANCDVEGILEKGGGDFDAEDYAAANGNYSRDVIQANYVTTVVNRCFEPLGKLLEMLHASPSAPTAAKVARDGIPAIEERAKAWLKKNR